MALTEINFDGIVGPSHNYAGLSFGNVASMRHAGQVSEPRRAALEGVDKMRTNLALGLAQGILLPQQRPHRGWLARLGTTSATFEHAAYRVTDDMLMCTAAQTLVLIDLADRQKATIPDAYRRVVEEFEAAAE